MSDKGNVNVNSTTSGDDTLTHSGNDSDGDRLEAEVQILRQQKDMLEARIRHQEEQLQQLRRLRDESNEVLPSETRTSQNRSVTSSQLTTTDSPDKLQNALYHESNAKLTPGTTAKIEMEDDRPQVEGNRTEGGESTSRTTAKVQMEDGRPQIESMRTRDNNSLPGPSRIPQTNFSMQNKEQDSCSEESTSGITTKMQMEDGRLQIEGSVRTEENKLMPRPSRISRRNVSKQNQEKNPCEKQSEDQISQKQSHTYKKRKGTSGISGQLYETKLLTLILFNALNHDEMESFCLGTNVDQVGAFDDVVFKYKLQGRDKARVVLIQAKHKEGPSKYNITREEVLKPDGDFSLHKYFGSYIDLVNKFGPTSDDAVFKDGLDSVELDLIIYTPAGEMITNKNNITELPNKDFLCKHPTRKQFRFHYDEKDVKCLIETAQIMNIKQLAQKLAQYVTGKQIIRELMSDELIKYYHVILKDKIIDVSSETFTGNKSNNYRKAKFRTSFLKNAVDSNHQNLLSVFKKALFDEIVCNRKLDELILKKVVEKINRAIENPSEGTISELIGNVLIYNAKNNSFKLSNNISVVIPDDIKRRVETMTVVPSIIEKAIEIAGIKVLEQLEFVLPEPFGNFDIKLRGSKDKQQKRLEHLATKFIQLFKNEKVTYNHVVTITDSMIDTDIIKRGEIDLNGGIAGLVGNLLILGEENKLKFNMDQSKLPENAKILLEKIQDKLLLDNELQNVQIEDIKFNIKVNVFPKVSSIDENYELDLVTKFLDKLEFHTNQANEKQMEIELKKEISRQHSLKSSEDINNFFVDVHNQVLQWWREDDYYLTETCDFFKTTEDRIISYPTLNYLRNLYVGKINLANIEFKAQSIDYLNIESFIDDSQKRILNIVTKSIILSSIKIAQRFLPIMHVLDLDFILATDKKEFNKATEEFQRNNSKVSMLLIISNNKHKDEGKLINELCKKFLTVNQSNKIIIISQKETALLSNKFDSNSEKNMLVKMYDSEITFSALTKESQGELLEKQTVLFQGNETILQKIVDDNAEKIIDLKVLDILVRNKFDNNKKILEIGMNRPHLSDLESIYYIACKNIEREQFINVIRKNPLDLFFITGTTWDEFVKLTPELDINEVHVLEDDYQNKGNKRIILTNIKNTDTNMRDFKWILRNYSDVTRAHFIEIENKKLTWRRTYDHYLYINRKLYYTVIDKSSLVSYLKATSNNSSPKKDIFVISGATEDELEEELSINIVTERNEMSHLIILNENNDFDELCYDYKTQFNIHWLQHKKCNLIWRRSAGDISIINKMIDRKCQICVDQKDLDEIINNEQITIISDEPGMGKTTSLTHLLESNPGTDMWIIKLNLVNIQDQLGKIINTNNVDTIIDDLFSKVDIGVKDQLAKNMLKYRIESQSKITLLFDGFDEITQENQKIIIDILTLLKNTKAKVQITSRLHFRDKLENALSTLAYSFQPFRQLDQELFLTNFWSSSLKFSTDQHILREEVTKLCEPFYENIQDERYEFMSIPLLTRMFAEIYQDAIEKSHFAEGSAVNRTLCDNIKRLSVLELYERFIERKYHIYFNDKLKMSYSGEFVINTLKSSLNKHHQSLAVKIIFPTYESIDILADNHTTQAQEIKDVLKVGIILSINSASEAFFSHKTFAEYFCAARLVELITTSTENDSIIQITRIFLCNHIFKKDYEVIRTFLDLMLAKDESNRNTQNSLHNAIIYKDLSKIKELLEQNVGTIIDRGGRSPLHLAAAYGCRDIFDILLTKIDADFIHLNDTLLDWTPLVYAAQYGHWDICKSLLVRGAKTDVIDKIECINFEVKGKTILHLVIENISNSNIPNSILKKAKKSLDKERFCDFINSKDWDMPTALHLAAECGNKQVVKLLLEEGADVNATYDKYLNKVMHVCVYVPLYYLLHKRAKNLLMDEQTLETFKMLLDNGADISNCGGPICRNPRASDYHYCASINAVLNSTLELFGIARKMAYGDMATLIKQGARINAKYKGKTPLHFAAENGNVDHVMVLLQNNASIDITSDEGTTPLHEAVKNEHFEIIKVLLVCNRISDRYDNYEEANEIANDLFDKHALLNQLDKKRNTPLYYAVEKGNAEIVKALLDNNANIYIRDSTQRPLLEVAILNSRFTVTKILLEHDANINARNAEENMPLHHYAARGQSKDIVKILQNGADVNAQNDKTGWTALHLAAVWGYSKIIKILIEQGANHNLKNYMRWTPLHIAVLMGHTEVVTDLIEAHADVYVRDGRGGTPINFAVWLGNINVVNILLQHKTALDEKGRLLLHYALKGYMEATNTLIQQSIADVNSVDTVTTQHHAANERYVEVIYGLLDRGVDVNSKKKANGKSPLHYAAEIGDVQVVHALLDRGADINYEDESDIAPLHCAARGGHVEVVNALLDRGAYINGYYEIGSTPLHCAVCGGHIEVIRALVESGANINSKDEELRTPLHNAADRENVDVVHALLDMGAVIDSKSIYENTPLHYAARGGHVEVVHALLDRGADINSKDDNGMTSLHYAAKGDHFDVIRVSLDRYECFNDEVSVHYTADVDHDCVFRTLLDCNAVIHSNSESKMTPLYCAIEGELVKVVHALLESGAVINSKDEDGDTPLHYAAEVGHIAVLHALLEWGADINSKGKNGKTPLHCAAERGRLEVVHALLETGAGIDSKDEDEKTPLHYATEEGHFEIEKELRGKE